MDRGPSNKRRRLGEQGRSISILSTTEDTTEETENDATPRPQARENQSLAAKDYFDPDQPEDERRFYQEKMRENIRDFNGMPFHRFPSSLLTERSR